MKIKNQFEKIKKSGELFDSALHRLMNSRQASQ